MMLTRSWRSSKEVQKKLGQNMSATKTLLRHNLESREAYYIEDLSHDRGRNRRGEQQFLFLSLLSVLPEIGTTLFVAPISMRGRALPPLQEFDTLRPGLLLWLPSAIRRSGLPA